MDQPDPRSVTDESALAGMLLGAGLAWPKGRAVASAIGTMRLDLRLRLADTIVGLPSGADPRALDPDWHTDVETVAALLAVAGVSTPSSVARSIGAMHVRDRARVAAYAIGVPPVCQ